MRLPINHENLQLRQYPSSTALQSNGSVYNASFVTSPSYDDSPVYSPIEVPNVAFAFDLSYHISISYYFLRSLYRREPMAESDFNRNRVHHLILVGSLCTHSVREFDSVYGLEDIYRLQRLAQSLYQCWLTCKDPFPPPPSLTQGGWVKDVWDEVCYRSAVHPSPDLLRVEEACLIFCHIWHSFI